MGKTIEKKKEGKRKPYKIVSHQKQVTSFLFINTVDTKITIIITKA